MSTVDNPIPWTLFDQKSFSGPIQMLKAAIPHLDIYSGRKLAMLIRALEFRQTMSVFQEEQLSICSVKPNPRPNIEDVLRDIRKYCAPSGAEQIDQFLNILNAVRIYNQYNELFKNNDFSNMMNQMNSIKNSNMNISPEQIKMLQNLIHSQSILQKQETPT